METESFQTEGPSIDLIKFQGRVSRQGLLLCIISSISLICAIINIIVKDYHVIFTVAFSVIDGFFGIIVGIIGYYISLSNNSLRAQRYKIIAILYSIIYILTKITGGILDIAEDRDNKLLIAVFILFFLIALPLCFYYSISATIYARKVKTYERNPSHQMAKSVATKPIKGSSSQAPLTSLML